MKVAGLAVFVAAIACLPGPNVFAQDDSGVHPFLTSKYLIQAGVYFPSKDFRFGVDGSLSGAENDFDFDRSTGLNTDDNVFALEFTWRFGKKWSARFHYFTTDQTNSAVLEEDIQWRDETILAGSSVKVGANFDLTRVFFGRSFGSSEKVDFGVGLGVHWLEIGVFIEPDVMTTFGDVSAASVSGPLPNFGTWYYYSPSPKWFIGGRLDWLDAQIDKYEGGILNFAAGVNYQMFRHVGIGVKYQLIRLDVDIDEDKWHGSAKLDFDGAFVYLSGNW